MAWYGHLDVLLLGLMLAYVTVTVIRVFQQTGAGRRQKIDEVKRQQLLVELKRRTKTLEFIAISAPYLGLAGTCIGILNMFGGGAMEKGTFLRMLVERVAAALVNIRCWITRRNTSNSFPPLRSFTSSFARGIYPHQQVFFKTTVFPPPPPSDWSEHRALPFV